MPSDPSWKSQGENYMEVRLMMITVTRLAGLAALVALTSVAAVHGASSDAAQAKDHPASLASSGSSVRAPGLATDTEDLQLLPNGDFEQGPVVWTEFSENQTDNIRTDFPNGVTAHSGIWAVWLGGQVSDLQEVAWVEQELTVPEGTTSLSFWYWLASQDVCGFDFGWLKVDGVILEQYDLCTANDTNTWQLREVDLSDYAGETVTLRFQLETDDNDNSNFFLDDVAFDVAGIFSDGFESGDTSAWSSTIP